MPRSEAGCSRRRAARDVHHHPRPAVHGRAGRGDRQYRRFTSAELAPLVLTKAGPAVQRFHGRLRCAANPGLLPPARILGGEGDVAGRAARAESRQRVRARQAGDCRRRALGHRLGEFSGQHGHRRRRRCGARDVGAGAAVFRAADFRATPTASRCCISTAATPK